MIKTLNSNYDAGILDKVTRLLDVLSEVGRHPYLSNKVCLHGGTAINLFMLEAPRLSIDADITYIGNVDKSETERDRPIIERSIEEVASFLGYSVTATKAAVAGRTFRLRYQGERGSDYIKIDINYLNRAPLLPLVHAQCTLNTNVTVATLSKEELIAGKTKALFDRVAVRDLYDISSLYDRMADLFDLNTVDCLLKLHRIILFYAAFANLFPTNFPELTRNRFADRNNQIKDELYPVLHANDRPLLSDMIRKAEKFVSDFVVPQSDCEIEYLDEFAKANYKPELLFGDWPEILDAAVISPSAKWKLHNLEKMPANPRGSL